MTDQNREPVLTDLIHIVYVSSMQKIAIPSLSYDPATDREMYPGTIAIIAAATSPAPAFYKSRQCTSITLHSIYVAPD